MPLNSVAPQSQETTTLGSLPSSAAPRSSCRILLVQHCSEVSGSTISGHLIAGGMRQAGWDVDVAFGFDGPYRSRYEEIGCRTHVVPHKNWLRASRFDHSVRCIASEYRNACAFEQLIEQTRPDVVYINSLVSLAAAVAARRKRVPCVWHVRELFDDVGGEMRVPSLGGKTLVRTALRRLASARVAISSAVAENVLGAAGDSTVAIVPNAVADGFFEIEIDRKVAREQLGLPLDEPIIGVPGTLRPMKGHEFFLKAAARLIQSIPNCRFAVTGTGAESFVGELKAKSTSFGLESQVIWLGTIDDMPTFYRACDVAVVPSVAEPFGRTAIEAFACGAPVVASAVGGLREIIEDGVNGLLVEYGDVAGLAERLGALLGDEELCRRLASHGRENADARYKEVRYQQTINKIVKDVVGHVVHG